MNTILIKCPICGESFKSLNSHVYFKHRILPEDLLAKFPDTILVPDSVKKKTSRSCKKSGCGKWMKEYEFPEQRRQEYSNKFRGKNNPFYGKKHTSTARRKMSKNHADFTGDKNPLVKWLDDDPKNRIDYRSRLCAASKKRWSDPEYRKKHSERLSKQTSKLLISGKLNPYTNCVRGWFVSKKFNNEFYYASSYELKFLEFCETFSRITSLQRPPFAIEYRSESGSMKNYNPDFLVNSKIVIEIKPKTMLNYNNNKRKIKSGKIFCKNNGYRYELITEDELKNLSNVFKTI